ncbi:glycosyltransferase [Geomonas paludis]|uniref:Glycosyltransferase n=1 Tax=Geomonas paludis TaxID=2740185 RepID=A0ABY4LET1_9BACT|nr:glycosyltransferase family 2 protein [Geomonas paludis]UPU36500.1 glycosyltransferase [Geomonas paludis]
MQGITIVTPSLNQATYLEQCIDSILSQNYPDLEYIIMDGGSTDGSVNIIRKYEKYLAYWQSAPDGGHYQALNAGFQHGTKSVMGWLNADDMLHKGGLAVIGEVFEKLPHVEFLTGRRVGFDGDGKLHPFEFMTQTWCHDQMLNEEVVLKYCLLVMQEGTYWRRKLWEQAGGGLNAGYKLAADFELWMRLSRLAPLYSVDALTGGFRLYSMNQRCNKHRDQYLAECKAVIDRERELRLPAAPLRSSAPPLIRYPLRDFSPPTVIVPREVPRLTIVTPSYNQAEYLEECLDSVLSQGYPNLEYIVMDGGSSDGSVEIIKKYEKHLSYWQSRPDGGHYAAVNEGFRRATGEVLAWINSDDKYHPGALHLVGDAFLGCPEVEWLTGSPTLWDSDGKAAGFSSEPPAWCREKYLRGEVNAPFIQQESTFWRRSLWEKVGGLDAAFALAGDLELWARFFRHARLYTLHAPLGGFRSRPGEGQRSEAHLESYNREAERVVIRERELYRTQGGQHLEPAPPPLQVAEVVRRTESRITPENFGFFTYSRRLHFPWFEKNAAGLPGSNRPSDCDLKRYQELLICSFIRDNVPKGARILGFGSRTSGVVRALEQEYEMWNLDRLQTDSADLLQRPVYGVRLVEGEIGGFSELLPGGYFDFMYSVGDCGELQHTEDGCRSIATDVERMLKPGAMALYSFRVVARGDSFTTPPLMSHLRREGTPLNHPAPLEQVPIDPFTFAVSQPTSAAGVIEREFSYNLLCRKAPAASAAQVPEAAPQPATVEPPRGIRVGPHAVECWLKGCRRAGGDLVEYGEDLSGLSDGSLDEIYVSSLPGPGYSQEKHLTLLREWKRVLKPLGTLYITSLDLGALAGLFQEADGLDAEARFSLWQLICGQDEGAISEDLLSRLLGEAGFGLIRRVDSFHFCPGLSIRTFRDRSIALNIVARRLG